MLGLSYGAALTFYLVAPLAIGWWTRRYRGGAWWLFGVGALTFLASQMVHLPLLQLIGKLPIRPPAPWLALPINGAIIGLAAGLCEEWARYATFRWVLPRNRTFRDALSVGAGHGGVEVLLLGLLLGTGLISALAWQRAGLENLGLPAEQLPLVKARLAAMFQIPVFLPLVGVVERCVTVPFHVAMTTLVAHGVRAGRLWPVWLAVALHAGLDAFVVLFKPGSLDWRIAVYYLAGAAVSAAVLVWISRREARS